MTERDRRHDGPEDTARLLAGIERDSASPLGRLVDRPLRRLGRHLAAGEADPADPVEVWGRRVGRVIAVAVLAALLGWMGWQQWGAPR